MEKNLLLREIYYSPKVGFRSIKHILEQAKKEDPTITESDVKDFLQHQETYTKYKSFSSPSFFRKTMVRYLGEQMQIDLVFMDMKHKDDGYWVIFNCIEILSRFAFAKPMKGKTGKESVATFKLILEEFKDKFHEYPKLLQADEGAEFINNEFQNYIKSLGIHFFITSSKQKAAIVERFNRTMKDKIRKLHDYKKTHEWVKDLPDIIDNYNSQEHSSIKMAPKDVNFSNQYLVWNRLFGHVMNHVKEAKFQIGDKVRVIRFNPEQRGGKEFLKFHKKKYPEQYTERATRPGTTRYKLTGILGEHAKKKYAPFTDEIFKIDQVLYGDPIVYKLFSEEEGIEIMGKFYEQELSLVK